MGRLSESERNELWDRYGRVFVTRSMRNHLSFRWIRAIGCGSTMRRSEQGLAQRSQPRQWGPKRCRWQPRRLRELSTRSRAEASLPLRRAPPERLGSFRTLKVPHTAAATSGTAIAAIHCTGPLVDCQAATPSPMSAPISSAKRSVRFQPAISGGFIRRPRLDEKRRRPCTPPQRQRERVEPSQMPPQP
jgi:hypothetical protein